MNHYNELEDFMEYRLQVSSIINTYHRFLPDQRLSNNLLQIADTEVVQYNSSIGPLPRNQESPPDSEPSIFTNQLFSRLDYVKFREIPFYEPLHILLKPFSPNPDLFDRDRDREISFSFRLSRKEVRDIVCNHECRILLRLCKVEFEMAEDDFIDYIPPDLSVSVNGKAASLPERSSKPVDITALTVISSTANNMVTMKWSVNYAPSYAITLYIAKPISAFSLLQKLNDSAVKAAFFTRCLIAKKIKEGHDSGIATTSIQVSLLCPLGKIKMRYPCRARTCTHIACFDAFLYIEINEMKSKWQCPICNQLALYKDLEMDGLLMGVISDVPRECTDVQFSEDGSWAPVIPALTSKEIPVFQKTSKSVEVIDISSDSDTEKDISVD